MKSLSLSCGALALMFTAAAAVPSAANANPANANGQPSVQDVCSSAAALLYFNGDEAACEQAVHMSGSGRSAVEVCKYFDGLGYGDLYGVNLGECVSFLQTTNNPSNNK